MGEQITEIKEGNKAIYGGKSNEYDFIGNWIYDAAVVGRELFFDELRKDNLSLNEFNNRMQKIVTVLLGKNVFLSLKANLFLMKKKIILRNWLLGNDDNDSSLQIKDYISRGITYSEIVPFNFKKEYVNCFTKSKKSQSGVDCSWFKPLIGNRKMYKVVNRKLFFDALEDETTRNNIKNLNKGNFNLIFEKNNSNSSLASNKSYLLDFNSVIYYNLFTDFWKLNILEKISFPSNSTLVFKNGFLDIEFPSKGRSFYFDLPSDKNLFYYASDKVVDKHFITFLKDFYFFFDVAFSQGKYFLYVPGSKEITLYLNKTLMKIFSIYQNKENRELKQVINKSIIKAMNKFLRKVRLFNNIKLIILRKPKNSKGSRLKSVHTIQLPNNLLAYIQKNPVVLELEYKNIPLIFLLAERGPLGVINYVLDSEFYTLPKKSKKKNNSKKTLKDILYGTNINKYIFYKLLDYYVYLKHNTKNTKHVFWYNQPSFNYNKIHIEILEQILPKKDVASGIEMKEQLFGFISKKKEDFVNWCLRYVYLASISFEEKQKMLHILREILDYNHAHVFTIMYLLFCGV